MAHPPLQAACVVKRFKQGAATVEALRGVDLTVNKGEFVAIMGASGSGKSTLLHVLAGLTSIDSGQIRVDGQDLATMGDSQLTRFRRQHIGLVFQAFNLIPTLTAEDNIRLPATNKQGLDERVDKLLDRLGIAGRRKHRPDALSGGEQQRVAIARALVTEPAIVMADEPTGSLDSTTGQSICRLLRELCDEEGRTIVVVTHEATVASWAQRVVILADGQLLTEVAAEHVGDAASVAQAYQDAVLAPSASHPVTPAMAGAAQ